VKKSNNFCVFLIICSNDEIRLVCRITSIVPIQEEKKYSDAGAVHLFYIQVKEEKISH
jgi:hypothetical protein